MPIFCSCINSENQQTYSGDNCTSVYLDTQICLISGSATCCSIPQVERILQGVDTVPVDVSSMLAQSSQLAQFAVSATATLARSRNHCAKNDVVLMNVMLNAWLSVILPAWDSDLPDPISRTMHRLAVMTSVCSN